MPNYQPLRITIHLRGPYVKDDHPRHLDALLSAMRVKQAEAEHGEGINPRDYHHDLPLAKHEDAGGWVFKASALLATDKLASETWMQTGRMSVETAAEHRASGFLVLNSTKPNLAGGHFKISLYHLNLVTSSSLVSYAVGDAEAVRNLLKGCRQVGARRGVGFGQVTSIDVDVVSESECNWQHRHMPLGEDGKALDGYSLAYDGLQAPYWDKALHQKVQVPNPVIR